MIVANSMSEQRAGSALRTRRHARPGMFRFDEPKAKPHDGAQNTDRHGDPDRT
ncbi:MAG TPA: hypothetical protein PLI13_08855 [Paracoccus sp. (in: a-proteobacteria)]|nr:hypothetical protein [Paracoccus sp. (in: a-proteobacteria)]